MNIKITGSGSYIPEIVQDNSKFLDREFFDNEGNKIETKNDEIIEKFQKITGIKERRYAKDEFNTSDIAYLAAKNAIEDAKIDPETIDYIILAHNFGNASNNTTQIDIFPSLSVRVKNLLKIKNPKVSELIISDFLKVKELKKNIKNCNACFHCMGITSFGQSSEYYYKVTFEMTKAIADLVHSINPNSIMNYVSRCSCSRFRCR